MAEKIQGLPEGVTLKDIINPSQIEGLPEGATLHDIKPQVDTAADVAKSGRAGLVQGAAGVVGSLGDARGAMDKLADWISEKIGQSPEKIAKQKAAFANSPFPQLPQLPSSEDVKKFTGTEDWANYQPQTTAGKYAKTIGEFVPGSVVGGPLNPRAIATNVARFGVLPGAASEAAGQAAEGTVAEPYVRAAASILAPGLAPRLLSPFANRAPQATRDAYAGHVQTLRNEGVPLTAGQITDNQALKYFEHNLNPDHAKDMLEGFTRAATRRAGLETPIVEHGAGGTVDTLLNNVGRRFDHLQQNSTLHVDVPLLQDLLNTHDAYTRVPGLYSDEVVNTVRGAMQRIGEIARHPTVHTMTGEEYQTLTSDLRRAARGTTDPARASALHDITESLDNAMGRSISRTNPQLAGEWERARTDYKRALVLERAATAAGESTARGYITPAQLASAAKGVYGKRAYERGYDNFSDLANAGASVLKALPDSGTAGHAVAKALFKVPAHLIGGGGGFLAGTHSGIGEGAIGGLLIGEGAAPIIEHGLKVGARGVKAVIDPYLRNQLAAGAMRPWETIPGLLSAAQGARQQ